MNFETFMESIKKHIKEYLPESYQDAQVTIREQQKLNNRYMGLTVIRPEDDRIPTINLTDLYRQSYENPRFRITDVLEQISQIIQREPERFDVSRLTQYEEAKKHLFMRVSNADKNVQVLEGVPFVEREDLAITFHIAVEETEAGRASAIVTNRMMETYGVTRNQLYEDALANSPVIAPVKINNLGELLGRMTVDGMKEMGASEEEIREAKERMDEANQDNPLIVVTNETGIDGAAAVFYPGVMDQLGEEIKGDFFILPSSVHEIIVAPDDGRLSHSEPLVVPDNGRISCHELKAMVMAINEKEVAPEDRLTDEVYHYDTRDHVFEKAEAFTERKRAKEQDIGKQEPVKETAAEKAVFYISRLQF